MRFFKMAVFTKKTQAAKGFQQKKSQQTFILEPLITPSGLIDSVDHTPHPLEIDLHTPILPVDLPDIDIDHSLDHAPSHTVETHGTTESIFDPVETINATTLDELNLHSAIAHDDLIAAHTLDTPIADHQLEALPFLHSTSTTPAVAAYDTTFTSGVFTVGDSGKVSIDYLFDGGQYQGQLAIFSLDGMEQYQPGSTEFITEAATRALSNSNLGHIVMSDVAEGARFNSLMDREPQNWNTGEYQGVNTFSMRPGEHFGVMLVPNSTVQELLEYPELEGAIRPLFSMSTANPNDAFHVGQIADVTNNGHTFVMEDLRVDGVSDHDYNDLIFQVRGATGTAVHLDDVIDANHDWRTTDMGKALIDYTKPYDHPAVDLNSTITPSIEAPPVVTLSVDTSLTPIADTQEVKFDFPVAQQPLIGVIDTGFSADNPDLDYTQITLGRDYVAGDDNPLLQPTEGSEHGTHVLGVIAATNDNDIGIDGINDQAPIWVGRATGSGHWADSLVDFVDYAQESEQPHAVVNLSLDLTQVNPDGSVTTRYEFTPQERAAIEYARQHDVLIVVAAGNDGGVMSALGQSSQEFDNIITVGAAHNVDTAVAPAEGFERVDYSSYGYGLDIMADGGTNDNPVISTVGDDVGTMAGTSVSTAQVTGAASQVWAANPDLSYRQVIEILKLTATDLSTPNWDLDTGAGLLNIAAAVGLATVTTPQEYDKRATIFPDTWSGEGKVTPSDRAASDEFNGKYYDWVSYTVKSGDSLSQIALDTMGNGTAPYYNFIAQKNGITNANLISVGQVIQVPQEVSSPTPTPTPTPTPVPTPNVPIDSDSPNYRDGRVNPFAYNYQRQCTWYAYGRMLETGLLPAAIKKNALFLGNAGEWKQDAEKVGLPVTSTPTQGARGLVVWPPNVKGAGSVGHVAFLEEVYPDGRIRITESNWPTGSWVKERTLTPAQYAGVSFVRLENAQTNSYSAPPATPGKQRQYTVRSGDTLSEIARRELGDGNRWREIKKADGSTFTEAEAKRLQVGMSVYLPVSYQSGTGTPVVSPPNPTPGKGGIEYGSYNPNVSKEFLNKVSDISQRLGVPAEYLMAAMGFETGGDYLPNTVNPVSGATGLIQFMPSTAKGLGTSTAALAKMSAIQQLDYVEKYFSSYKGRLKSLSDVYMAVLWPAAIGKNSDQALWSKGTIQYTQNSGLDIDKNGKVTVGEATSKVRQYLPAPGLFA